MEVKTNTPYNQVLQFIENGKLEQLKREEEERKKNIGRVVSSPVNKQNTICNHYNVVQINELAMGRLRQAIPHLEEVSTHLQKAQAALHGFDEINKQELEIAERYVHAYIYMLNEYIYLSKQKRKPSNVVELRGAK